MRLPAFAGSFYPGEKKLLEKMLAMFEGDCKQSAGNASGGEKIISAIAPHAGYVYSGKTAMHPYYAIKHSAFGQSGSQKTFAIFCPNHTGNGAQTALSIDDWQTPLGIMKSNVKFCREFLSASHFAQLDEEAHGQEHSLEVQLPFVQKYFPSAQLCAIAMSQSENALDVAEDCANAVIAAEKKLEAKAMVIASSDFSHYEQANIARQKDDEAVQAICKLDAKKFCSLVTEKSLSICGYAPILVSMIYAKKKGAKEGRLLHFSNSGEISGDEKVVDYASIAFV